jgi:hypothetical protein
MKKTRKNIKTKSAKKIPPDEQNTAERRMSVDGAEPAGDGDDPLEDPNSNFKPDPDAAPKIDIVKLNQSAFVS